MKTLSQWQKLYPDVIRIHLKTLEAMSHHDCRKMADSLISKESSVIDFIITPKETTVYVSKQAFEKGIKDVLPS